MTKEKGFNKGWNAALRKVLEIPFIHFSPAEEKIKELIIQNYIYWVKNKK